MMHVESSEACEGKIVGGTGRNWENVQTDAVDIGAEK